MHDKGLPEAQTWSPDEKHFGLMPSPSVADRSGNTKSNRPRGTRSQPIPVPCAQKLSEVAHSIDATFFAATCAVFLALLHRYTGIHDIVIGIPNWHRFLAQHGHSYDILTRNSHLGLHRLSGYVANTFAFRARTVSSMTFSELLQSVACALLGLQSSFDTTASAPRAGLQAEAVRVQFDCGAPSPPSGSAPPEGAESQAETALEFAICETDGKWYASALYSSNTYDESTIAQFLNHYIRLVEEFGADPEKPIGAINMLTAKEREQILVEWNQTQRDFPRNSCVHELFEVQARDNARNVAVVTGQESITYGELNQRANHLANRLAARGVGANVLVGLCVTRSIDFATTRARPASAAPKVGS